MTRGGSVLSRARRVRSSRGDPAQASLPHPFAKLAHAVLVWILAACGERNADTAHPAIAHLADAAPSSIPSTEGSAPHAATPRATDGFEGPMLGPMPSAMLDDLAGLGLDPKHLPPLAKLEPQKLRRVMPLFAKALGVKCAGCHADDSAAPTPEKRVAEKMWNEYVGKLTFADGSPLFCDSCHQGRVRQLDRRDPTVLGAWMNSHFVSELARKDGQEHGCATCHGPTREMHFIDTWKKG